MVNTLSKYKVNVDRCEATYKMYIIYTLVGVFKYFIIAKFVEYFQC